MSKKKPQNAIKSVARITVIFLIISGGFRLLAWLIHLSTN